MIKVVHLHWNLGFALRLHNEFLKAGIDSRIISSNIGGPESDGIKNAGKRAKYISWLENKIQIYLNRNTIEKFGSWVFL